MRYFFDMEVERVLSLDDLRKEFHVRASADPETFDEMSFTDFLEAAMDFNGGLEEIPQGNVTESERGSELYSRIINTVDPDDIDDIRESLDEIYVYELKWEETTFLSNLIELQKYKIEKGIIYEKESR